MYKIGDIVEFTFWSDPKESTHFGKVVEYDNHVSNVKIQSIFFGGSESAAWIHFDDVVRKINLKDQIVLKILKLYND